MLALDLGVFHTEAHSVSFKEATIWTIVWISLALVFNGLFYYYTTSTLGTAEGTRLSLEFLTGYVVEKSLSVDNIFIFVMVFGYFAIPAKYQHRVLFYGIIGALIFRAIFIAAGAYLMQIDWIIYLFGRLSDLYRHQDDVCAGKRTRTGKKHSDKALQTFRARHTQDSRPELLCPNRKRRPRNTAFYRPFVSGTDRHHFRGRFSAGDFCVDEGTDDRVYVKHLCDFGSARNVLHARGCHRQVLLLKYGLSVVLIFVGLKMAFLNDLYGGKFPIGYSLGFILSVIFASVVLSLLFARQGDSRVRPKKAR